MGHLIFILLFLSKMNSAALFDVENINKPKQDKVEKEVVSEQKKEETKSKIEQIKEKNPYAIGKNNWQINLNFSFEIINDKRFNESLIGVAFGGVSPFTTYHPSSTGFSLSYGLTDEIHFSYGMPLVSVIGDIKYVSYTTYSGSPYLSAVYSKKIYEKNKIPVYLTAYPYVFIPWFSKSVLIIDYGDSSAEAEKKEVKRDLFEDIPFQMGGTTIVGTNFKGIIGELFLNLNKNFGSDLVKEDLSFNFAAYLGYKFNDEISLKTGINKSYSTYDVLQFADTYKYELILSSLDELKIWGFVISDKKILNQILLGFSSKYLVFTLSSTFNF